LPKLLTQFGFSASLAVGLLAVENALGVIMEPLMGGLSDQANRWVGSRFPLIALGVILSSALFISIPSIVTFVPPLEEIRGILPLTLVAWALAMTVFRSPAIALLGKYATVAELPLAASFVTLAAGVIGAFRPIANNFILGNGPIFTFAIGSFVLLAAVALLRFVSPPEHPTIQNQAPVAKLPLQGLSLILATSFGIAWGSRLLMDALGKALKSQFDTEDVSVFMVGIGLMLAFAALPAGAFAVKIGNRQAMVSGVCAIILSTLLILYIGVDILTALLIIASLSLIINGAVPFAIGLMPPQWTGLGTGTYFGGFSLGMSVFGLVFPSGITPLIGMVCSTLAFLFAGVCIVISIRLKSANR